MVGAESLMPVSCKLCLAPDTRLVHQTKSRRFVHCPACGLVFVPAKHWLTVHEERARYAHHHNTPANVGYVTFLGQVADVVGGLAIPGASVLDFGSGENAVLCDLLRQRGYACTGYDPLYAAGAAALQARYDVIVVCEVIEHLRDLRGELATLTRCLAPSGAIVVRTQRYPSIAEFATWWYARDATHINFFQTESLAFAARLCGLTSHATDAPDIAVWRRP
jgi:2-polyprenyl-3-methyl-5-hydroxy-6-metoxy-1,4-benzoquinol methylase